MSAGASGLVARLLDHVRQRHPRNLRGIEEARAVDPARFDALAERFLGWALAARGDDAMDAMVDAFARFSSDVILAQARYEVSGRYEHERFADCQAAVYDQPAVMTDYLWGILLTNVLWVHHFELCLFFERGFLARIAQAQHIVEIAPGHGGWGVWALERCPAARLEGFDVSATSIAIATRLAVAAGHGDRAVYHQRDALALPEADARADAVICCFVVEHLEDPDGLFAAIGARLRPGGHAFVTGALTAAQIDHIYEFRHESELVLLAEKHGMRVIETYSGSPRRTLPKARFLPRSMGLVLTRRRGDVA